MNEWNQTRANVVWLVCLNWATFASRFLIYWLKLITYCIFKLINALLIYIFSYRFYYNYFFTKGSEKVHIYEEKQGIIADEKLSNILLHGHSRPRPSPPNLIVFVTVFLVNKSTPSISLRESSPGRSGSVAGKGRRAWNYVSWI